MKYSVRLKHTLWQGKIKGKFTYSTANRIRIVSWITMIRVILILQIGLVVANSGFSGERQCEENGESLKNVVEQIVEEITAQTDCTVFITDSVYRRLTDVKRVKRSSLLTKYEIILTDDEQFSRPKKRIEKTLVDSKTAGCGGYVILIGNGLLASKFLQYAERERLINTRGLFLLLHDSRLFKPNTNYIWNRIINVVFIRRYNNVYKHRSGQRTSNERIDLETVYFPPRNRRRTPTKFLDSWYRGKLRYGLNHFKEKTRNLQTRHMPVAVFEHIPAVTDKSRPYHGGQTDDNTEGLGIEFELIQMIAKAMNFKPKYYMPYDIESEKWGTEGENQTYTGLLDEAVKGKAAFYLGDLHYTMYNLHYFDLTIPYNTECLTFLTPESLTENSWKLLILPFKLYTWIAVLLTLICGGVVFYLLSFSYERQITLYKTKKQLKHSSVKEEIRGLYLFTEIQNSILYAYGMLVQVSLPDLPNPWPLRVLIGWWWIYSILVAVAYRASMTATLANPVARVTIDTLAQLAKSSIEIGGWSEKSKDFFLMSSDPISQEIGSKFQLVKDEEEAIKRVANGSFCYFENSYLLRHGRVKWQILKQREDENETSNDATIKYNLHIMEECAVNMPIAIGMQKNSPLKRNVDRWIRRIMEAGLVEKWLSDVMEWSKITEIRQESESEKALVNFRKLQGAFIAVVVGYLLAFMVLLGEIFHWKYVVLKNPNFDKYYLDLFYKNYNNDNDKLKSRFDRSTR